MEEGMEGKNLEQEEKVKAFIEEIKNLIKQSQELDNKTVGSNGYEVSFDEKTKTYSVKFSNTNILLAKEDEKGFYVYPEAIEKYNKLVEQAQKDGVATLDRPAGLVESKELEEFLQKQKEERGEQAENKEKEQENEAGEEQEEEKGDEKPKLEETEKEDEEKEKIAKKYNVKSNQVIHLDMRDEKITKDKRFCDLVSWAGEHEEIYVIPGEDEYTWKTIGRKKGEKDYTEIKGADKQIYGKNPNITIKRMDGNKITEVKPLAMYDIDGKSARAIVKDEYGRPEQLYCRKQEGKEEFFGIVTPEASGKNVRQSGYEERTIMDPKSNSSIDLNKKEEAFEKAKTLEEKGVPSKEKGVQAYEINGSDEQNRNVSIEEIVRDLMQKDGITDRLTMPPNYYENKANKVLALVEEKDLNYEQAIETVEKEGNREKGGRTPGEKRRME